MNITHADICLGLIFLGAGLVMPKVWRWPWIAVKWTGLAFWHVGTGILKGVCAVPLWPFTGRPKKTAPRSGYSDRADKAKGLLSPKEMRDVELYISAKYGIEVDSEGRVEKWEDKSGCIHLTANFPGGPTELKDLEGVLKSHGRDIQYLEPGERVESLSWHPNHIINSRQQPLEIKAKEIWESECGRQYTITDVWSGSVYAMCPDGKTGKWPQDIFFKFFTKIREADETRVDRKAEVG